MIRHWTPERYISKIVYDGRLRPPRQLGFSASFDQDYVAFEKDPPSDLLGAYLKECKKAPCFALDFNEDNLKTVKLVQRAKYIDLIDFGPLDCSENELDKIVGDFVWVEGPVSLEHLTDICKKDLIAFCVLYDIEIPRQSPLREKE